MKKMIWGAANRGVRFYSCLDDENEIYGFIDSNKDRGGTVCNKPIIHPDEIANWKDIFLYVPYNYYDEISKFLSDKGLTEGKDFTKYDDVCEMSSDKYIRTMDLHINALKPKVRNEDTLFVFTGFNKHRFPHFNLLKKMKNNGISIIVLANGDAVVAEDVLSNYMKELDIFRLPIFLDISVIVKENISLQNVEDICNIDYVKYTIGLLHGMFPQKTVEDCRRCAVYIYNYARMFFEKISPKTIMCFGSSNPLHYILYNMCKEYEISVIFTHEGIIPGTYVFETRGEMGESIPSVYAEKTMSLPITRNEIDRAECVLNYIRDTRLNRRKQAISICHEYIDTHVDKNKPIVFFAGQNDVGSHMVPYTDNTRKFHSPIFKSSTEAAIFLATLCKKNNWNFIYKPHPYYKQNEQKRVLPPNTIFLEEGDVYDFVDIADVTVTILSATNYNALFRNKPVVMLGYNQIRGKGCTYEAYEKEKIEKVIKDALKHGFTEDQKRAFCEHVARVLKYYLYDDMQDRSIRYGKILPKSIDDFYELERMLDI